MRKYKSTFILLFLLMGCSIASLFIGVIELGVGASPYTEYVLLDEPTNNLDIYHATNLMKTVRRLCDELGKTVILVLHEINYAAFYSDYICAFKNGKIAKYGTVEEVMTKENLAEIYNVDFEIMRIEGRPLSIYY